MLMRWHFLLCSFCCVWAAGLFNSGKGRKTATLERFDKTCGARTMPMIIDYQGLRVEDDKVHVNCTIAFNEDVPDDPRIVMDIHRCKSKEALDSCEPYRKFQLSSYCNGMRTPGFYNTFTSTFQPPHTCPLKKGVYKTDHGIVDIRAFIIFPMSDWYWKVKLEIFEKNSDRKLLCMIEEFKFI